MNFQLYAGFVFYRRNVKKIIEPTGLTIEKGNPPTIYSIFPSLGPFGFFSKICGDIRISRCTTAPVSLTPVENEKSFNQKKVLSIFIWTPLGRKVYIFSSSSL
jgi:hypothetical protein